MGRFGGPQQGAGASRQRRFLLLLAGSIFVINLYLYLVPRGRSTSEDAQHGLRAAEALRATEEVVTRLPSERQEEVGPTEKREKKKPSKRVGEEKVKRRQARRDPKKKKNVLFIMTDDLRPSLSVYDKPVITPAFERLADMGVVFERAYNQDPICNPSRNSMLSGRRPDSTRVWLFEHTVPHEYSNIFKVSAVKRAGSTTAAGSCPSRVRVPIPAPP